MPRNGSGTFTRTNGDHTGTEVWQEDAAGGIKIVASRQDVHDQDMADALTASIAKDGQTVPTANLPMGGFRHTGVGASSADSHYATVAQCKNGEYGSRSWIAHGLALVGTSGSETDERMFLAYFGAFVGVKRIKLPKACQITHLSLSLISDAGPGVGKTITVKLRKNGVATGQTISISNSASVSEAIATITEVDYAAGDYIDFVYSHDGIGAGQEIAVMALGNFTE